MKYFFEAILFAVFLAALANSSVKLTESNNDAKKTHFNNVNYNYYASYAGPNTERIEQQLAEMKQDQKSGHCKETRLAVQLQVVCSLK